MSECVWNSHQTWNKTHTSAPKHKHKRTQKEHLKNITFWQPSSLSFASLSLHLFWQSGQRIWSHWRSACGCKTSQQQWKQKQCQKANEGGLGFEKKAEKKREKKREKKSEAKAEKQIEKQIETQTGTEAEENAGKSAVKTKAKTPKRRWQMDCCLTEGNQMALEEHVGWLKNWEWAMKK